VKVTNEKTESRQAFLKIEMEPADIEASTESTYRRLVKKVDVPGFRRGKAPRPIFERYYDKHELFHEMLDDLVPKAYQKAVEEQKLEPIAQPQIEVVEEDPVILKAVVSLKPVVTLGDYRTIDLTPQSIEVTEEMVEKVTERLRHQHATWEPVDREVAVNDLTTIDIESTIQNEPYVNRKGVQYQVLNDSISPAPGFAEQLVGMKKGEEKEFTLQFPTDYARKEVAGKEATFKVKVTEIQQEKLPEVTDGFAAEVNAEYQTVEILRQKILEDLKKRAEEQSKQEFENKVIETATAMSQLEYPPVMVEAEIDRLLEREFRFLQQTGQEIEQYLKSINKTLEQMRQDLKPAAEKRIAQSLVLGKISEEEKITVAPNEIDAEIEEMVKNSSGDKEALRKTLSDPRNRESVEDTLITRKVIQRLSEIARSPKESQEPKQEV